MKITFGKFDGTLDQGRSKSIHVDGVEVGYIEANGMDSPRIKNWLTGSPPQVVADYTVNVWDGPEAAAPLLPLDGRVFDKLSDAQQAVRDAYASLTKAEVR